MTSMTHPNLSMDSIRSMTPVYADMSLVELKQAAKARRIKQYYVMKRAELVELLSMKVLPESYRIDKMTIHSLRDVAREKGIRGVWALSRTRLVELLFPDYHRGDVHQAAADKDEKNQGDADKHDDPQKHHAEDVGVKNV
jgi:hypothetical protein